MTALWDQRERRILEAVRDGEEAGERVLSVATLAEPLERPLEEVRRVVEALHIDGWLTGVEAADAVGFELVDMRPTAKTRRYLGDWPAETGSVDVLLETLASKIDEVDDDEERSKLQRFLQSAAGVSREVLSDVLAAVIVRAGGM